MTANVTNCWALEGSAPGYTTSIVNGNTLVSGGFMTADSMKSAEFAATLSGDNAGAWVIPGASEAITSIMTAAGVSGYPVPAVFAPNSGEEPDGKELTYTVGTAFCAFGGQVSVPVTLEGNGGDGFHKAVYTIMYQYTNHNISMLANYTTLSKALADAGVTMDLVIDMNGNAAGNKESGKATITLTAPAGKTITANGELFELAFQMTSNHYSTNGNKYVKMTAAKYYDEAGTEIKDIANTFVDGYVTVDNDHEFSIKILDAEHAGTYWLQKSNQEDINETMVSKKGGYIYITATPQDGYILSGLTANVSNVRPAPNYASTPWSGGGMNYAAQVPNEWYFVMPGADVELTPVYTPARTITVDTAKTTNGTLTLPYTAYGVGATVTVDANGNEGYLGGILHYAWTDAEGTYHEETTTAGIRTQTRTFTMPDANVTVWMEFQPARYVTAVENPKATFSDIRESGYTAGSKVEFKINLTDSSNYPLSAVQYSADNGETWVDVPFVNNWGTYRAEFIMPDANTLVRAVTPHKAHTFHDGVCECGATTDSPYTVSLSRVGSGDIFEGDTLTLQVKVTGDTFDGAKVTLKYPTGRFTFVPDETDAGVVDSNGTITITRMAGGYPAGSVIATLKFTAKDVTGTTNATISISEATADTFVYASTGDARPASVEGEIFTVAINNFASTCTAYADYVTGYTLVVVESNRPLAFDGSAMYLVEAYDTSAEGAAYAYLVKGAMTAQEAAEHLSVVSGDAGTIAKGDADVNNTGKVDFNDALAGMVCYKVLYDIDQYMAQYLRADVNGDHIVNAADVNAILASR
jgi:hypothetical protein